MCVAGGLLAAAVVAVGLSVWRQHDYAVSEGYREVENLATVLSEQTNHSLQSIDLLLNDVQSKLESFGAMPPEAFRRLIQSEDTYNLLNKRLSNLSHVSSIGYADKSGQLLVSTNQWPLQPIDISDRERFQHFKNNDDKGTFVAKPVINRVTGVSTIYFSRRFNDANNELLGIISVGVELGYFQHIYSSIASLPDQSFLFLRKDGSVIVRYPDNKDRSEEKMPERSPWHRLVTQDGGHYRSPGYFDGIPRLIGVRPLRNYPLVINVAVSEAAVLASWRNYAIYMGIGTLLAVSGFVFLLKILSNQITRLFNSKAALLSEQSKLDAAMSNMSQGLCMFDAEQRLIVCNRRYADIYGLSAEQTKPGTTLRTILAHRITTGTTPEDHEQYLKDRLDEISINKPYQAINHLRDGRYICVLHRPMADGGWVATHEDVTEAKRSEARISYLAHHDPLTELPNRKNFQEHLEQALKRVGRGERLAVYYLDLDHFKTINDTRGHLIGDQLLKAVAERLQNCIRDIDTLARLGGDEFAIVQVAVGQPSDVAHLATRILEAVKAPYDLAGHQLISGVSIGIAMVPDDGVEAEQLLKNADMALYQAKTDGRGTFCFFEPEMDARVKARSALEFDIRQAIMGNEFELHYQPLVDLRRRTITCCEALLRWRHPERGIISPAEFIPVAEETGLINQLGEWVIKTACAEAVTWPNDIKVAVNISPVQLKNKSLALTVISALAASGLKASRLELEITESVLIHDEEETFATLAHLQGLGVRIVMDDFGTGYSSLAYLQRIPFDKIKIDRSFIKNIADKDGSLAIVQAIVIIAESRNIATVAEGVETEQQLELIGMLRCTEMQGFLFSRPVTAQNLLQLFSPDAQWQANAASAA